MKTETAKKLFDYCEKYIDRNDYIVLNTEKIGADKTSAIILEKMKKGR